MKPTSVTNPSGTRPISIEVEGEPQGVVIPEANGFRFLAVRLGAFAIDGRVFASVAAARDAARSALRGAADAA